MRVKGVDAFSNNGTVVFGAEFFHYGISDYWDEERILAGNGGIPLSVADNLGSFESFGPRLMTFGSFMSINDTGTVASRASFDSRGEALLIDGTVWLTTSESPYSAFGRGASINNGGMVAFTADLDSGGQGVFTGADPTADKVVAAGDMVLGCPVSSAYVHPPRSLNDAGQVVCLLSFGNGGNCPAEGVYVATPLPP